MSSEVIEIISSINTAKIENQLILQCAPLIVGLRISSLMIIQRTLLPHIYGLLKESRFCYYVFRVTEDRVTLLLYQRSRLTAYLSKEPVRRFLHDRGYTVQNPEEAMRMFRCRYQKYHMGRMEFPHELGLMLGYPIEDVEGFIKNKGKNPVCCGYWKVYHRAEEKKELFRMCELAREMLAELFCNGAGIQDILELYSGNEWNG